jgi:hypothetical protein
MGRGGGPEAQLRGPVEILMSRVGRSSGLDTVPYDEVQLKGVRARPDFAVDVGRSRVGYIELKAPGRGVPLGPRWRPSLRERQQWEKLQALPNLIYTDGSTWCRYSYGIPAAPAVTLEGSLTDSRQTLRVPDHGFTTIIFDFLTWQPEPPRSLSELIRIVAGLCNLLHDEVYSILEDSPDHAAHQNLTLLADEWRDLLFPGLDARRFADAFAQTITFALLLARVDGIGFDRNPIREIARLLTKKHSLIGQAFEVLTDRNAAEELRTIETLRRIIGVVKWEELEKNLRYAELYERFLAAYDPKLRKSTGSFYTPPPLARFMVSFLQEVLLTHFRLPRGFADDDVIVVDPAMGTGTFLVEVVRSVASMVSGVLGEGYLPDRLGDLIRDRLIGFEIQVAPYAVAELQMHNTLRSDFELEVPSKELRFLTDALANPREQQESLRSHYWLIQRARDAANKIKRDVPVMVVVGNPPHVQNARGRAPWIEEPRRYGLRPGAPVERPSLDEFRANIQGQGRYESDLHGMPWYFWRWACWKVFEAHPDKPSGLVAFITPSSFLKGRAFAGIREYLRRNCDKGWIIELSPEGNRPPTATRIFGTEVGRQLCIAIFARQAPVDLTRPAEVLHLALYGSHTEKLERLERICLADPAWASCDSNWHSNFLPASTKEWEEYPTLNDLMPWRSRGVTPGRTWVYAPIPEILRRRWRKLVTTGYVLRREMFVESVDRTLDTRVRPLPGFKATGRALAEEQGECPTPVRVAYRSFDRQWVIPDSRLMVRPRPPLWQVRSEKQVYVSEQDAHEISSGPGLVFTGLIPDLDHFSGWGGGGVRPLWRDQQSTVANLAPGILEYLSRRLGLNLSPSNFMAYVAAIVAHPGYTTQFREELKQPGVRIPLSATRSVWIEAISLGEEVIWLHTFGTRYDDAARGRRRGDAALIEKYAIKCLRAVITLPEQLPDRLEYDAKSMTLLVGKGAFSQVAEDVLNYDVGGRRILLRWLNVRALNPRNKRRSSQLDDIGVTSWTGRFTEELHALLSVLTGCVALQRKQHALLQSACAGPLICVADLRSAGVLPVDGRFRKPPGGDAVHAMRLL